MKKICIIFLAFFIIILSAVGLGGNSSAQTQYLRIHIRANSNLSVDQAVKYRVRDGVVEYLTPLVAECETRGEAEEKLSGRLDEIACLAGGILSEYGFSYGAKAALVNETFPTRLYGEYTLPAGEYRALIVCLGEGAGDNWWCVVYPPLCFSNVSGNVVYKSKIAEIIEQWRVNTRS